MAKNKAAKKSKSARNKLRNLQKTAFRNATTVAAPLDPIEVQDIVIRNTPKPAPATGTTQLKTLGVVNKTAVGNHRAGIRKDIEKLRRHIDESDIVSSPATTVATCRTSVINNAT